VDRSGDFPKERFRTRTFTSNRKRDATASHAEIDRGWRGQIHTVRANILRYPRAEPAIDGGDRVGDMVAGLYL
jgi:hypothetical protein